MSSSKIGFEVPQWKGKPMSEYTDEELLEYYFKLRVSFIGNYEKPDVSSKQFSPWIVTVDLQAEIIRRMKGVA